MLQKLNERIQGLIAWIVVILVAVTFTIFGLDYYLQARHDNSSLAEVNGQVIENTAFREQYRRQTMRQPRLSAQLASVIKNQVLQDMIVKQVTLQAAHELGFEVSPAQANATILAIPQFQNKGQFSTAKYAQALQASFFTPNSLQTEVQNSMVLNQQQFAWVSTDFLLPETFAENVRLFFQTRDYDYLIVPAHVFLPEVKISTDQIKDYYQKNTHNYLEPEQISIEYLHLSMADLKNTLKISPEEIKQYYDDNHSDVPFQQARDQIKQQILTEKAQTAYSNALEQLSELSYENPESLSAAARILNLPIQHSEFFSSRGGSHGITQNQHVVHAAFRHDVLLDLNNSAPIPIGDNEVVVLRIKQRRAQKVQSLAQVAASIEHQLAAKDSAKLARQWAKNFLNAHASQSLSNIPNKIPALKWQHEPHASRTTHNPCNKTAFGLSKIGLSSGVALENGDYAIVQLKNIQPGSLPNTEQSNALQAQWAQEQGGMLYEAYIHDRMQHAKIKHNRPAR